MIIILGLRAEILPEKHMTLIEYSGAIQQPLEQRLHMDICQLTLVERLITLGLIEVNLVLRVALT